MLNLDLVKTHRYEREGYRLCVSISGGLGSCITDKKKPLVREALRLVVLIDIGGFKSYIR